MRRDLDDGGNIVGIDHGQRALHQVEERLLLRRSQPQLGNRPDHGHQVQAVQEKLLAVRVKNLLHLLGHA